MERKIPFRFDVSFEEGGLHPTSDPELFEGKVRVFYKYSNRNGSYITDTFANKLAETAYNKPVMGYYDIISQDFQGHEGPEKAKAYGFVIPNSLVWTDHLDDDGVTRTYATYDVLVWAKYWEEARKLFVKTQSMEIDPDTVQGEWRAMNGNPFEEFVFTEGVMAGLCILGDMKTPCFEGAAFFSVDDDSYKEFTTAIKNYFSIGGKDAMNVKVAGLEHEHFEAIWNALNPNFNEEGAYSINLIPCEITEENIFALSCEHAGRVNKYSYSIDEEGKLVIAEEFEVVDYKHQVAEFEAAQTEMDTKLADALNTYTALKDQYDALMADKEALQSQFEALQGEIEALRSTLETKEQEFAAKQEELNNEISAKQDEFNAQAATLVEKDATIQQYSATIAEYEKKEKETIINKFAACMPAEALQSIIDKKDSLTIKELNTELALEYTKFSMAKEQKQEIHIPQEAPEESSLVKLLKNYKK